MVCPNEFKQLRKHSKPLAKAKHKAGCFSASEIKSICYTESQAYITSLIYNSSDNIAIKITTSSTPIVMS